MKKLVPPDGAPPPYRLNYSLTSYAGVTAENSFRVRDARGAGSLVVITEEDGDEAVARYLVAAANEYQGLVADVERLSAVTYSEAREAVIFADLRARVAVLEHALGRACEALRVHSPIVADAIQELANKETL